MRTLQLSRSGIHFFGSQKILKQMQESFDRNHFIRIRQFLHPELLKKLKEELGRSRFYKKVHKGIGTELCMFDGSAVRLLSFLLQDPVLFRYVEAMTGCKTIGCLTGRIYRMNASEHSDDWHNDLTQNRMVAMSLNLSPKPYQGGHLLMRSVKKGSKAREVRNTGFGDIILFRIRKDLQHCVQNITGSVPKTAFAGWFRSKPDYRRPFKQRRRELKMAFSGAA